MSCLEFYCLQSIVSLASCRVTALALALSDRFVFLEGASAKAATK